MAFIAKYFRWIFGSRIGRSRRLLACATVVAMLGGWAFLVPEISHKTAAPRGGTINYWPNVKPANGYSNVSLLIHDYENEDEDFEEEIDMPGTDEPEKEDNEMYSLGPSSRRDIPPHGGNLTETINSDPKVNVYNVFQEPPGGRFDCVVMAIKPEIRICLYDVGQDIRISPAIRKRGLWQPFVVENFRRALEEDPGIGLIDIGANLGQFSLIAASRKRNVLATEPYSEHLRRFTKAINLASLQRNIVVLQNVVSDKRGIVSLSVDFEVRPGYAVPMDILMKEGAGTFPRADVIYLDDTLPYVRFNKAIIVIDTEIPPHLPFSHAYKLFDKIDVQFIFMTWTRLRYYIKGDQKEQVVLITRMVTLFKVKHLNPFDPKGMKPLNHLQWGSWPDTVMWVKDSAKMLKRPM